MGGRPSLDDFPTLTNPLAERIAALAANIGRQTADVAFRLFEQPIGAELRKRFERETVAAIGDLLDDLGQFTGDDRERFQHIAAQALDRRLAHHAAAAGRGSAA